METRKTAFAGSWYPAGAAACEREIKRFLSEKKEPADIKFPLTGGIVPHAGWYFSGQIACNVIELLSRKSKPDIIIICGMHLHPSAPSYIMSQGSWETPFGALDIATDLADQIVKKYLFEIETPTDFIQDNTIELQLPFIKYFFKDVKILPIGMPPTTQSIETGRFIGKIAKKLGLIVQVIGSTDLTHYGANYGFTGHGFGPEAMDWVKNTNDRTLIEALCAMNPELVIEQALKNQNACCSGAAATAIALGLELGAETGKVVSYATSYDKSPGDSFVGYVGVVF